MTGFGDASGEYDGAHYTVEIRSVNNRFFKAIIRLPDDISGLEAEIDSLLRKRISRGSVTVVVTVRDESARAAYTVNRAALDAYLEQVAGIEAQVELGSLLALPGVVQPPERTEQVDRARPAITELVGQACDRLAQMREREGKGLAEDLMQHKQYIGQRISTIAERAPAVVDEYHQRLRARIDNLLARAELEVGQSDLIKEVAVFAERSDVAEETQRISAHLQQFDEIVHMGDGEPAGRTLDFLAQELLREANTIASKSNDAAISRTIVEVKGAIDRIKEQVQNVE